MKESSSDNNSKRFAAIRRVMRFGVLFSAVMVCLSFVSSLSTQLISRLGRGGEQVTASSETKENGLQPYEAPAFRPFSNLFVNEAHASSPPGVAPSC